ncbi:Exostosin family protein [Klebsormidium nitens]|uniref:Exostosin family protein n=1 Tax=Klebsormidium nitens TaxID=105231 RepID=A0A1Y1I4Q5_KLENI|nr:Exostosin family protein [Klebsormidium nitens]|eukprot:GAQ83707.1 Exostosin family protein [Klebsormidium nitens]
MCDALQNEGRGEPDAELCRREALNRAGSKEASATADSNAGSDVVVNCSWFRTNQFSLEVLLHHRLRGHPCRVGDPSEAQLYYVPFYTGLEIKRSWGNQAAAVDRFNRVLNPLVTSPYFQKRRGLDHFMAFGRMGMEFGFCHGFVTWLGNVTKLMIEAGWNQEGFRTGREIGVPYPTGFHPAELADVNRHRRSVRGAARDILVSYAGAVGRPYGIWAQRFGTAQLRARLAHECERMRDKCRLVVCDYVQDNCSPSALHDLFMRSTFCLQPQGDSPTRRSTFDALLAGCIPIFFHTDSFQSQYEEALGVNASEVSVFIAPERLVSESWSLYAELEAIDEARRKRMQSAIVDLVPRIVYGKEHVGSAWKDAVDIALEGVMEKAAVGSR